jgi:RNA polymerase sigma factor for flagellar operon FliA
MAEAISKYSIDEREEIIKSFLPYIKYTASRLSWRLSPSLSEDDLISAGITGLLDALERYDASISKMSTYVEYRIKGAMLDLIDSSQFLPKHLNRKIYEIKKVIEELEKTLNRTPEDFEIAESAGITLDEYYEIINESNKSKWLSFEMIDKNGEETTVLNFVPDKEEYEPDKVYEKKELIDVLSEAIENLSEKEKLVLNLYYYEELTMKEISKVLGVTEGRVCQLHNQALIKIKAALKDEY